MRIRTLTCLSFCMHSAFAVLPAAAIATTATSATASGNGGDNFGGLVQQNTGQALQVFQDVNYKKLSGSQDQNYFFGDDQNTDLSALAEQFKLAPEN